MKFEYYEVRPCIEADNHIQSFRDEDLFNACVEILKLKESEHKTFWTIYGMNGPEAVAIGDFTDKKRAHEVLYAILAPMAEARDLAQGDDFPTAPGVIISPAERAASCLDDVINQSSNMERI